MIDPLARFENVLLWAAFLAIHAEIIANAALVVLRVVNAVFSLVLN